MNNHFSKKAKTIIDKLRKLSFAYKSLTMMILLPASALASQTGTNPWEVVASKIVQSLTGPMAYAIAIISVILCGAYCCIVDLQTGMKKFVAVSLGCAVIFGGAQIVTWLGFQGALI